MVTVAPPRQLKTGTIIDKTLGVVEYSARAVAIYVVALTLVTGEIKYLALEMTRPLEALGIVVVSFVVGITAAYLLLDAMVRKTGLWARTDQDVFFPYFALSILYTLGVGAGMLVIILPGLVVMARWSLAQPMMIARGDGVMQALGASWERTKGNEFQIIMAILAVFLPPIAIMIACSVLFDPADPVGIGVSQLASSVLSALSLALWVALYGLMESHRTAAAPAG